MKSASVARNEQAVQSAEEAGHAQDYHHVRNGHKEPGDEGEMLEMVKGVEDNPQEHQDRACQQQDDTKGGHEAGIL